MVEIFYSLCTKNTVIIRIFSLQRMRYVARKNLENVILSGMYYQLDNNVYDMQYIYVQ